MRCTFTVCMIIVAVETFLLLNYAGYLKISNIYPDLVLEQGWTDNQLLPPCQYTEIIVKHHVYCYLFVAVMVRPSGFDRRDVIRKTWYRDFTGKHSSQTQLRFFVGTHGLSKELLNTLQNEQALNHDIVMLDQFVDSYKNLTRKTMLTMKWTAQNVNFTYYLKCDDDSYPLLHRIIAELQQRRQVNRLYWGHFFVYHYVKHKGKNIDRDWFLTDQYTPFAIGGAYILSGDLVHLIVGLEQCVQYYPNEDVSIGLWLAPYQIERKHDYRFCRRSQYCLRSTIMFLGRSKKQLLSIAKSS